MRLKKPMAGGLPTGQQIQSGPTVEGRQWEHHTEALRSPAVWVSSVILCLHVFEWFFMFIFVHGRAGV